MPAPSRIPPSAQSLSEEDLRALARRHAAHLRKFQRRREREKDRIEQQAAMLAFAQQLAAMGAARPGGNLSAEKSADSDPARTAVARVPAAAEKKERDPRSRAEARHFAPAPEPSAASKFLRNLGVEGLSFSLVFHAALCMCALFWVVSTYVDDEPESPPTFFATGSGGGRGGDRPSYADVQASRRSAGKIGAGTRAHKIVSKAKAAKITLPEMPEIALPSPSSGDFSLRSLARGIASGELSSGSGGGLGGGVGRGLGAGIGGGRNFVGKFRMTQTILGTDVTAERLAVYLDNSGSMTEVIPVVRDEILKKFPTADVYEFSGCGISDFSVPAADPGEEKFWKGRRARLLNVYAEEKRPSKMRAASRKLTRAARKNGGVPAWRELLSSYGKALLGAWANDDAYFFGMDLGRWLNMTITDGGYDALIVFADFQDYRDGLLGSENEALARWLRLSREHGQRLYFFTTEMMPQSIFLTLADFSGGDVALPKETAKETSAAKDTKNALRRRKPSALPAGFGETPAAVPAADEEDAVPAEDFSDEGFSEEGIRDEDAGGNALGADAFYFAASPREPCAQ